MGVHSYDIRDCLTIIWMYLKRQKSLSNEY
jgi:hypothetical protein